MRLQAAQGRADKGKVFNIRDQPENIINLMESWSGSFDGQVGD